MISVSNLFPIKNIDLIVSIAKKMPDSIFTIVGDGPERKRLEAEEKERKAYREFEKVKF